MKILKRLMNRIVIFGACLVLQFVWYIFLFWKLANYSVLITLFFSILSVIVVLVIVSKDQNPDLKIPWIIEILVLPLLGGLLYLAMGTKRPARKMRRKLDQAYQKSKGLLVQDQAVLEELKKAEHFIFMEYFIIADDNMWRGILDILKEKVKEGVDVRLIYDDIGCLPTSLPSE